MRMWGVDPEKMCRKHLLGEHVEMHMFMGTIKKGISIKGYIETGLVNPHLIALRHQQLADELKRRGFRHNSEMPENCNSLPFIKIDVVANEEELKRRCPECKKLLK